MKQKSLTLAILTAFVCMNSAQGGFTWSNVVNETNGIAFDSGLGPIDVATLPAPPFTLNPTLQYNKTLSGVFGDSSTAAAGFGYYTDSHTAIITASYGMGDSQSAPFGAIGPAVLETSTDEVFFGQGSGHLNAFYSFPIDSWVSQGGFEELQVDLTVYEFWDTSQSNKPGVFISDTVHFLDDYKYSQPGHVQTTVSNNAPLMSLPDGSGTVGVNMNLTFKSLDPNGPSSITVLGGGAGPLSPAAAPEPASLTLFGIGALGMAGFAYRRRRHGASSGVNHHP